MSLSKSFTAWAKIIFLPEEGIMKKRNFLIAMAGISLALGMMVLGCDQDGGSSGSGTATSVAGTVWEGPEPESMTDGQSGYTLRMTFTATTVTQDRLLNDNFVQTYFSNASYTYSGGTVTITFPAPASRGGEDYLRGILATVSGDKMTAVVGEVTYTFTKVTSSTPKPGDSASLAGTGWTKYNLLLEDVTEGVYYNATAYNSEGAAVGTASGVKATGETVAITLKPGTKAPDPYFYPGGPYSVQLKGIAMESNKSVKSSNKITDTETREISDFFFNEGDHGNTVEVKWEKDSVFVSRTLTGSAGSDANKVAVSLTVNAAYEYKLSVTIADYDAQVVSRGSVVPEWFDESDGSELWTFEPDVEADGIWTEPVTVYTGDLISVMRNIIDNVAAEAAEDEPKAEKPVVVDDEEA
jgi:hypothetical protein